MTWGLCRWAGHRGGVNSTVRGGVRCIYLFIPVRAGRRGVCSYCQVPTSVDPAVKGKIEGRDEEKLRCVCLYLVLYSSLHHRVVWRWHVHLLGDYGIPHCCKWGGLGSRTGRGRRRRERGVNGCNNVDTLPVGVAPP